MRLSQIAWAVTVFRWKRKGNFFNVKAQFLFIYMKPQNLEKSSQIHFKLHREKKKKKKDTKNTGHTHNSFTK